MKICFYPGCSYASTAGYKESTEAVADRLGIELVTIHDWSCCGATVMFGENTLRSTALAARHFALVQSMGFSECVTGCNACYLTLCKTAKLLKDDEVLFEKTKGTLDAIGLDLVEIPKIRHLLEVISDAMPHPPSDTYKNLTVGAYYGCQLTRPYQAVDNAENPGILESFLSNIGFSVAEHSAKTSCCGASHGVIYSDTCAPLSQRIINEIKRKGGQLVTTICPLCQFNLDQSQRKSDKTRLPVTYFTQLAGLSLGLTPSELGMDKLLVSAKKVIARS